MPQIDICNTKLYKSLTMSNLYAMVLWFISCKKV